MSMTIRCHHRCLRDYAFDCSDKYNFPAFGNVHAEDDDDTSVKQVADERILRNRRETGR